MAIKTIGTAGNYTTVALWGAYIKALGTLTENEVGVLIDDAEYAWGSTTDLSFNGVTPAGFTITLKADDGSVLSDVRHNGDFGNGARIVGLGDTYSGMYRFTSVNSSFFIEDMSFTATLASSAGSGTCYNSYGTTLRRCIGKKAGTSGGGIFEGINSGGGALVLEACRAISTTGAGRGFYAKHPSTILHNCTATNVATGFETSAACEIKNCVAYNTTTDYVGTWGAANNNASEDGTHPGAAGVLITANPFEVDGYTSSEGGQLDAAGINLFIELDAANIVFQPTPAIGAYEAPSSGITITNVFWNPPTSWDYVTFDRLLISPESILFHDTGTHDGTDNASVLNVSGAAWTPSEWIGFLIKNPTDGSEAIITANTSTTITATLAGGTENDWDIGDIYEIVVNLDINDQIVFETITTLSGTVSLSDNGIPSIIGIGGSHSFDYKIRDITDFKVSTINTVTITV